MRLRFRHYMKLTENELITRLSKRNFHPSVKEERVKEIIDTIREQKEELRRQRGKIFQHTRMWEELMAPLKYERKVVRALLHYPASEERRIALETYHAHLDHLVGKMTLLQRAKEFTPYQLAKANNRPNNGEHWTDWVGPTKKQEIAKLFDAIPKKIKAKKKLPFERTIPKALWSKLHARLLARTQKELAHAEHLQKVAKMKGDTERFDKQTDNVLNIGLALSWIEEATVGEALPLTWRGYFYNKKQPKEGEEDGFKHRV